MSIKNILEDEKLNPERIRLYIYDDNTLAAYGHSAQCLSTLIDNVKLCKGTCPVIRETYLFTTFGIHVINHLPEALILNISDDIIELVWNTYATNFSSVIQGKVNKKINYNETICYKNSQNKVKYIKT